MQRLREKIGWWLMGVAFPNWDVDPSMGWRGRIYRFGSRVYGMR